MSVFINSHYDCLQSLWAPLSGRRTFSHSGWASPLHFVPSPSGSHFERSLLHDLRTPARGCWGPVCGL
jgi:hypothetical protein